MPCYCSYIPICREKAIFQVEHIVTILVQLCALHLCSVSQFVLAYSLLMDEFIQLNPDIAIIQIFHVNSPVICLVFY